MAGETTRANEPEPSGSEHSRFSSLHSRTYEMELLLSGAVLFGLVKLAPFLSMSFDRLGAGLAGNLQWGWALTGTYFLMALYVLIGTFLLHLILRALWIGLLGLESVFPGGIRWERLQVGPNTLERYRRSVGPLARSIERADDFCSLIFSFGFLIIVIFVYSIVLAAATAGCAFAVSHALLHGTHLSTLFWTLLAGLIGLQVLVPVIDKKLGPSLDPEGAPNRLLRGLVALTFVLSPMRWAGPVQLTLQSNFSETRVELAIVAVALLLSGALIGKEMVHVDKGGYFPASLREHGLDPGHYRDRRVRGEVSPRDPSIQAEVIRDPYLELSIPYYPRLHNPLIDDRCPDLDPLRAEGLVLGKSAKPTAAQVRQAATCFGSLFEVSIDGVLLDELRYEFAIESGSELEAMMVRIPVGDLSIGRHEVLVLAPGRPDRSKQEQPEPIRHLLPFWR